MSVVRVALLVLVAATAADARARPFRVRFTPFVVEPSRDRIACEYVEFPNRTALDVRRFAVHSTLPLHHVLFQAYVGTNRDPQYLSNGRLGDGIQCFVLGPPDMPLHSTGLLGAVRPGVYDLPAGYAVTLLPRQPVGVVMHLLNVERRPKRARVALTVVPVEPRRVRHHLEPIDVLDIAFELPPHQTTVHTADFIAPIDMNVAMLASHQHRYGTRVTVNPLVDGVEQRLVYDNGSWREPKLQWLDPPVRLRAGDRLRVRCEWNNLSDTTLRYGGSASDEMCNLNGYFFRDVEVPPEERHSVGGFMVPVAE